MSLLPDVTDLDLEKRVNDLTRELAKLKRAAASRGYDAADTAKESAIDAYAAISDQIIASLPKLRRGAKSIEKTAYDHPATVAAIGLLAVGLMATLLFRRR